MNEIVLLWSADADVQSAYESSEAYQADRGEVFLRHLNAAFGHLITFPMLGPVYLKNHRRLVLHSFPYGIFYTVQGRRVIVSGVMHLRQSPDSIRRRLLGDAGWT